MDNRRKKVKMEAKEVNTLSEILEKEDGAPVNEEEAQEENKVVFCEAAKEVLALAEYRGFTNEIFLNAVLCHMARNYGTVAMDKFCREYVGRL